MRDLTFVSGTVPANGSEVTDRGGYAIGHSAIEANACLVQSEVCTSFRTRPSGGCGAGHVIPSEGQMSGISFTKYDLARREGIDGRRNADQRSSHTRKSFTLCQP